MNIKIPIFLSFLKQPYPYYYKGKNLFYFALILFSMSLLFNYLFQPFVVYHPEHKMGYFWISFLHSLNAFLVVLVVIGTVNKKVNEDHWKVFKELVLIGLLLLLVGISQFIIRDLIYENPNNWSLRYLIEEVRNTFLAGILFMFIIVPFNYIRLQRSHFSTAEKFNLKPKDTTTPFNEGVVQIITHQQSDNFQLNTNELLYAKSEGNYLELFLEWGQQTRKLVKRMSLKDLENQLETYPQFFKSHRSYLVNLQKVKAVKGNAQGYLLFLNESPENIPVSRGMLSEFEKKYSTR